MGLQYVDGTGTERTLTVADMLTQDFQSAYSDLFKGLHGFRPSLNTSPEDMLRFFDTYEAAFEENEAEEAAALARVSERDGIQYRNWMHYYDEKEKRDYAEWQAEEAKRQEAAAHVAEFNRRGSPLPTIEAWEHGAI
jgi:hypothetical protein